MTQSPAEFVDDPRFSKTFELQPNPATGRAKPFKLQYADYGYRNGAHPERENVLLFFAGLMGSRLVQITKDEIARKNRVRIIAPDRPGVGGTDAVDGEHSMDLWRGKPSHTEGCSPRDYQSAVLGSRSNWFG